MANYQPRNSGQNFAEDGEFMLAARYWDGGLRLVLGAQTLELSVRS